jgi:hypothetical protein
MSDPVNDHLVRFSLSLVDNRHRVEPDLERKKNWQPLATSRLNGLTWNTAS